MKGYCPGICVKLKAPFDAHGGGYYTNGHKRCNFCDIFIQHNGPRCPCCKHRLRSKPLGNKQRKKLLQEKYVYWA